MKTMPWLIHTCENPAQSWTDSALPKGQKVTVLHFSWGNTPCGLLSADNSQENIPMCKAQGEPPPTWDETKSTYHMYEMYESRCG